MSISHKRMHRVVREICETRLESLTTRWQRRKAYSKHLHPRYLNLVNGLVVRYAGRGWVRDISYVWVSGGFIYPSSDDRCIHPSDSRLEPTSLVELSTNCYSTSTGSSLSFPNDS